MGAEAARVLDYFPEAAPIPSEAPGVEERMRQREKARAEVAAQTKPMVSPFALFGSVLVTVLMIFVVLAQINYNEAAAETVRLNAQLTELTERHRALTIAFESVISMKEVEQYARDVLGMSKPENFQMAVIQTTVGDRAEVLRAGEANSLRGFASFISSLLEYFRS